MSNISEEYAEALFTSLNDHSEKTQALTLLRSIVDTFSSNTTFIDGMKSKAVSQSEIKSIFMAFTEQLNCGPKLTNFFQLLIDKKRLELISEITESFQGLLDQESGITRGVVKSAHDLSLAQREELEEKFSKKLNKKVILTYMEDKKVLAGVRVELDAYTFDDTVETHIKNIKESMNRSAH